MLGAEVFGRSYGGGILKMEPREAAQLPVPSPSILVKAWKRIERRRDQLDELLRAGRWQDVLAQVDDTLLVDTAGLPRADVLALRSEAARLRRRRTRQND